MASTEAVVILLMIAVLRNTDSQFTNPYVVLGTGGSFVIQNSDSQISTASTAETLVIPGDTTLDSPGQSIIEDRYKCTEYDMSFTIPDPVTDPLTLTLTVTTSEDKPKCTVYWADGLSDDSVEIDGPTEIEHTYTDLGIYAVSMSCDNDIVIQNCPGSNTACFTTTDFMDDVHRKFETPMTFFNSEPVLIKSYMELASGSCGSPSINWKVTEVNGAVFTPFTGFVQPNNSVIRIEREILEPGEYVVSLEVAFPSQSPEHWGEDLLIMKVVLPELVTHISGGELLRVPHGQQIYIDATISTDPVHTLPSLALTPLVATWSFAHFTTIAITTLHTFLKNFPASALPAGATNHLVQVGSDYALGVDTSSFPLNSYAVAMFTLSRGARKSSAMQVIRVMDNVLPISIECVYNCHIGRERLIYYDKLELDAKLPDELDTNAVSYSWEIKQWNIFTNTFFLPAAVTTQTGLTSSSLGITSFLTQGTAYKITVKVTAPGYATSEASFVITVNYIPYGGTCVLNTAVVTSARDWLTLTCSAWNGNDDRKTTNLLLDNNPILTYKVRQQTIGALVEEEPILQTRSQKSHVILKVGSADNAHATSLFVQITDMFNNYHEVQLSVTSNPAFSVNDVTPTDAGAALVQSYTGVDYPFDEQQLRDMGKSDMIISLVSAVCSNLHLIDLPEWEPPVPRVLNTGGAILDLSPGGNTDVGTLDDVSAAAENETVDPATLAIQDVMLNMTRLIRDVVETDLLNGTRKGDKMLSSLITNAFTNLAAKSQFVNTEAKVNLIYLSDVVGEEALEEPQNTTADLSAQIETTSGEIYYMFQAVVNAVVPDNLKQIRPVQNLKSGRVQIDEMLSVIGQNISVNDTILSPVERAYLYMRMQRKLRFQTDQKKNSSKEASKVAIALAKNIQEKLKVCSTCSNEGSNKTKQLVKKNGAKAMKNELVSTESSFFRLDGLEQAIGNTSTGSESVSVSAYEFTENVFMYDEDGGSSYVTSNILRVDAKTTESRVTPGFMTFQQSVPTPDTETVIPDVDEEDASEFMYHEFIYQKATDYVCIIILPLGDFNFTEYIMYIKFSGSPSIIDYDFRRTVSMDENWQNCIPPEQMKGNSGINYLAVSLPGTKKTFSYNFTLITVGCLTWEEAAAKWHSDKCTLEWYPQYERISCYCEEVTDMVFANSFFVAPNTIDFSTVFLKFSPLNQAAVMGTLIGIAVIYIVTVILLVRLDRRDTLKWGITPLRDNLINDENYYLIKVCTGMRRGAGTRSRIAFVLTGERGDTGPRELFDGIRTEFSTGSIMSFFMATKKHLGALEHLYIWHDNSGKDDFDSWYPNQVVIYDVERRLTYTFVLERWLSLETTVDANVSSTPQDVSVPFESRFFYQTRDRLSESHMWVSILYRPQISTFTRVQRASCALVYIFLTMIANAMYFNPEPEYESTPLIQIGPLRFTAQQIFISLVCALMTTPVVMLLIFIFKRSKYKHPNPDNSSCCNCCKGCFSCGQFCRNLWRTKKDDERRRNEEFLKSRMLSPLVPDFSGGIYLPWWCVYFAWFLVLTGTVVPAFFILLYSMEWGKQKSEEWLTTFSMSLLESMLLVDPITVICIAFVLALLIRGNKAECNVDIDIVVQNYRKIMGDEKDVFASSIKILKSIKTDFDSYMSMPLTVSPPLKGTDLTRAADKHRQHTELMTTVKDFLLNVFFMLIILTICFSNRDNRSYLHYAETVNTIVEPWKMPHFHSIKTPGDLYNWLNITVFPSLFPEFSLNGAPLHWTVKQFTTGYNNLRLGPPRLRQLRTKNGTCSIPYIGEVQCYGEYKVLDEDDDDYCLGWHALPCDKAYDVYNVSVDAWKFKSAFDVWGLPLPGLYTTYGGGGYIATLAVGRSNSIAILNELFQNLWMDRQTRAVMFEFTLYNGATNLFIYHIFLVEFPQTGGAFTSFSIYPIRVYTHQGSIGTLTLICEVIFVIYFVVLLVKICIRIYQQRCGYFKQFWQVFESAMLVAGVTSIVIYVLRLGLTYLTIRKFKQDRNLFVDFSHIVLWDQILVSFLAVLVFMATLRILEIFATSKKISAIVKVFQDCGKDLFWYGMTFLYIFFGFCFLGMLLFGSELVSYMSIYQCMGTLFIAMIGKSHFTEINETQPFLAKLFFVFYILTVVFFILTIFLSILGASIDSVTRDTREDKREDIIEVMMKQIKHLFVKPAGKKETNKVKSNEKRNFTPVYNFEVNRKWQSKEDETPLNTTEDSRNVQPKQYGLSQLGCAEKNTLVNSWLH